MWVESDPEHSKEIRVTLNATEQGIYYLLVEYHQLDEVGMPVRVRVEQNGESTAEGSGFFLIFPSKIQNFINFGVFYTSNFQTSKIIQYFTPKIQNYP